MPGVNYREVQMSIPMAKVLELLSLGARGARGGQFRGPCPVHRSASPPTTAAQRVPRRCPRSFSAHLHRGVCHCFTCGFAGNQIQLWAACKGMRVYEAAVDLCRTAGVEVPWVERW